jgi:hypothetical protein
MNGVLYCHELFYWISLYLTSHYFYVRYYNIGPSGTSPPRVRKVRHAFTAWLETAASTPDYLSLLWSCAQRIWYWLRTSKETKTERICPKEEYSWDVQGTMERPAVMLLSFDFQLGYIDQFGRRHYTGSWRNVVACVNVGWIPLAQDRFQWRAVVTTIMGSCMPLIPRLSLVFKYIQQIKLTRLVCFKNLLKDLHQHQVATWY